jgi:hypothetical protein
MQYLPNEDYAKELSGLYYKVCPIVVGSAAFPY